MQYTFFSDDVLSRAREAKIEFGDEIARKLKLTKDGKKVLWPQPADDPEDPQNASLSCFEIFI